MPELSSARCPRFNGAAVRERRRDAVQGSSAPSWTASRGPPSVNGGEKVRITCRCLEAICFNGAAVRERRRAPRPRPAAEGARRFNGAAVRERRRERSQRRQDRLPPRRASMGPPSVNGGELRSPPPARIPWRASMGPPSVNGGERAPRSSARARAVRFNGAAVRERRRGSMRDGSMSATIRFNGAAVRERRRGTSPARRAARTRALQWGRRP